MICNERGFTGFIEKAPLPASLRSSMSKIELNLLADDAMPCPADSGTT
jgi:hypothetical protein